MKLTCLECLSYIFHFRISRRMLVLPYNFFLPYAFLVDRSLSASLTWTYVIRRKSSGCLSYPPAACLKPTVDLISYSAQKFIGRNRARPKQRGFKFTATFRQVLRFESHPLAGLVALCLVSRLSFWQLSLIPRHHLVTKNKNHKGQFHNYFFK